MPMVVDDSNARAAAGIAVGFIASASSRAGARPHTVFGGTTTLVTGGRYAASLLLTIIPAAGRSSE